LVSVPYCLHDRGEGHVTMEAANGRTHPQAKLPTSRMEREETSVICSRQRRIVNRVEQIKHFGKDRKKDLPAYLTRSPARHELLRDKTLVQHLVRQDIFPWLWHASPVAVRFLKIWPPMRKPENREILVPLFFNLFNSAGLAFASAARLKRKASETSRKEEETMTEIKIKSKNIVNQAAPAAHGRSLGNCIKHVPIYGPNLTHFSESFKKERNVAISPQQELHEANTIFKRYIYICPFFVFFFLRHEHNPRKSIKNTTGLSRLNSKGFILSSGLLRPGVPSLALHPEIINPQPAWSLKATSHEVSQLCPLSDSRVAPQHFSLSEGSNRFRDFENESQRDLLETLSFQAALAEETRRGRIDGEPSSLGQSRTGLQTRMLRCCGCGWPAGQSERPELRPNPEPDLLAPPLCVMARPHLPSPQYLSPPAGSYSSDW
uniref:Uncharacterized protein n=1 Tax=Sus scrofa TaxID=9823 RepID=A0A8D0VB26_PIG